MRVLDLSYHPLDCRSGGWVDLSRKGNHGMPYGGARPYMIAPGVMGYRFGGSSGDVKILDNDSLNVTSEIAFGAWVLTRGVSGINNHILRKYDVYGMWVESDTIRPWGRVRQSNGVAVNLPKNKSISLNKWYYLAVVADSSDLKVKMFIDGELNAQADYDGTIQETTDDLFLASYRGTGEFWNGLIAQPIIEDRAWSEAEVRENMYKSPIYRMLRGLPHSWIYTKVPWKQTQGGIYVP